MFLVVINDFRGGKYTRQRYKAYEINNQLHAYMKEYYFLLIPFFKVTFGFDMAYLNIQN